MEWQPIETAPKDGAIILGWLPAGPWLFFYSPDFFVLETTVTTGSWPFRRTKRTKERKAGWVGVVPITGGYGIMGVRSMPNQPTHWRPLPEPPKSNEPAHATSDYH